MVGSKSITIIVSLAVGLLTSAVPNLVFAEGPRTAGPQNPMRITIEESTVSVHVDDNMLLRYRYENVPFKPYIQQLFSPRGVNVLRDAPYDHLHHHSLMFAVAVDSVNFWEERQNSGQQAHRSLTDVRIDKHNDVPRASFTEHIDWVNPSSQELLLKERRTIEAHQVKDLGVTLLTWQAVFEPPQGKKFATLTGSQYFGLGMRFLKSMDIGGQFRNADGKTGVDGTNNVRAAWCAYTASANGKPVTIAMFNYPDNERHPATWYTLDQRFAYLSATLNLHNEPLKVTSNKPLTLRYGVALWDGRVEADQIEQVYQRWLILPAPATACVSKPSRAQ